MDSSRREKREVNPPTVYRPEAVCYHPESRSGLYIQQWVRWKPNLGGLLTYSTTSTSGWIAWDRRRNTNSRYSCGSVWQFTNSLLHWPVSVTGLPSCFVWGYFKHSPFLPAEYSQFVPYTCLLITFSKEVPWLMSLISFVRVCCLGDTSGMRPTKSKRQRAVHYPPERGVNRSIRFFDSKAKCWKGS